MIATKHHYIDISNKRFKIGFQKPKKDQCDNREGFKNASAAEKAKSQDEHSEYLKNKEAARQLKEEDKVQAKNNKKISMSCFDFQKQLLTPQSESSVIYFKRRLTVSNFTIYDCAPHEGICYVWSEADARKVETK